MDTSKPWYSSVTVWGSVVTLFVGICGVLHLHPDQRWADDATQWLVSVGSCIGGAVALYGRLKATKQISGMNGPNPVKLVMSLLIAGFFFVSCTGCSFFQSPSGAYVAADRATHDAIAPEYSAYVHSDTNLTPDQISRRDRTLATWESRLEDAETRGRGDAGTPGATTQPAISGQATQPSAPH